MSTNTATQNYEAKELKQREDDYLAVQLPKIRAKYSLPDNQAVNKAIVDIIEEDGGDVFDTNLTRFDFIFDNEPERIRARLYSCLGISLREQKIKLVDQIGDLLVGTRSASAVTHEKKLKLYGDDWTVQRLERRRDEIIRAQQKDRQTKEQLRAEIKPASGIPSLPREIVPQGEIRARKLDREYLIHLSQYELEQFKKYVRIYGADSVNQRLNE